MRRELRAAVRLAAPVVIVQMGLMAMGVIDAMMLGRVSAQALAAGALGNVLAIGLQIFAMGILMALDPLVSQADGAGDDIAFARALQRGLLLAIVLAVPLSLAMWEMGPLLRLLGQQEELIVPTAEYIRGLIWGNVPLLVFTVLRQTLQATSRVRQALLAIAIGNAVNVPANLALIFGFFGAPRLGVLGSAYATSISRWVMAAVILAAGWRVLAPYLRDLRAAVFRLEGYLSMLRLGLPIGVQLSMEFCAFACVALLMGNLGTLELAAHQIAINLASMAFMVPLGIAGAAATRVGNAIGRRDPEGARRAMRVSLALGGAVMLVSASAFALFPSFLARLYTPETAVVALAAQLLPIAAIFQVADGVQAVGSGILRGAADTRLPAVLMFVGYWLIGIPIGAGLAFGLGWGPIGLWWALTIGLATVASLLVLRIRHVFGGSLERVEAGSPMAPDGAA